MNDAIRRIKEGLNRAMSVQSWNNTFRHKRVEPFELDHLGKFQLRILPLGCVMKQCLRQSLQAPRKNCCMPVSLRNATLWNADSNTYCNQNGPENTSRFVLAKATFFLILWAISPRVAFFWVMCMYCFALFRSISQMCDCHFLCFLFHCPTVRTAAPLLTERTLLWVKKRQ